MRVEAPANTGGVHHLASDPDRLERVASLAPAADQVQHQDAEGEHVEGVHGQGEVDGRGWEDFAACSKRQRLYIVII